MRARQMVFVNKKHAVGLPAVLARTLTDLLQFPIDECRLVIETNVFGQFISGYQIESCSIAG